MWTREKRARPRTHDVALLCRLAGYLRPYRYEAAAAVLVVLARSGLQLVPPFLTKIVIDRYIHNGDLSGVALIAVAYLATLLLSSVLDFSQSRTTQLIGQRVTADIRVQLHSHLRQLDIAYYDRTPVGHVVARLTSDVNALNELFNTGFVSACSDVLTMMGIVVVLVVTDRRLAGVGLAILPAILFATRWFRTRARTSYREIRIRLSHVTAFLHERISGILTIRLFRKEAHELRAFRTIDRHHRDAALDALFYACAPFPIVEFGSAFATAMVLWSGSGWILQGTMTIGVLVAFIQYLQRFFRPLGEMSQRFDVLQMALAAAERIFVLLDAPIEPIEARRSSTTVPFGPIAFEHVTFGYVPGEPVLKDVSFIVMPGQRFAIVGATGAGKTTILNLLLRFYEVQGGRITINRVDIREIDVAALRSYFSVVLQDVQVFSDTVAGNVRLGHPDVSDDAVVHALEALQLAPLVQGMSRGIASAVAERGATLSVGQRQLLSMARALAFDRPALILDEATSSIDTETELRIRAALEAISAGRTSLVVAHRLSTIQDMDHIVVLHKGVLREQGRHRDLLAQRGIYSRLHELQSRQRWTHMQKDDVLAAPLATSGTGVA